MKTDYENGALPQTPQGMLHPLTLLKPVAAESGNRQIGGAGGRISPLPLFAGGIFFYSFDCPRMTNWNYCGNFINTIKHFWQGGQMNTVYTQLPMFDRPGPLRELANERELIVEWLGKYCPAGTPAGPKEKSATLMAHAAGIEMLMPDLTPIDRNFFEAAKKLKLVASFGVGIDHIDLRAATEHGVLVTNVPGINARSVAELALALMLCLTRKVAFHHRNLFNGLWRPGVSTELSRKTLGIVGLGHIGQELARLCSAFDMRLLAANRTPRPDIAEKLGVTQLPLETVLKEADFVSLHIPGGPDSWHLGEKEFALMKPSAFLINTARGGIVDLDALTEAIREGRLGGAGLDVFPEEPINLAHPLFTLDKVVLTPHVGGTTHEAWYGQAASCLDECVRLKARERSVNARNPEIYEQPCWKDFTPARSA
jgi:phosphoglycerate dehydrogenase-like enzyme